MIYNNKKYYDLVAQNKGLGTANREHTAHIFHLLAIIAIGIVLLLGITSCKTPCLPVVEYRDSIRVEYRLDSTYVYVHDSVYRDRWRAGDTVYIVQEKYKTLYKDKIVLQHDTINTVQKDVQQIEVIPRFYRGCTIALWIIIALAFVGCVVYITLKRMKI